MLNLTYLENIAIAGRTGSGKSALIHKMIKDFQKKFKPEERQLVLIDTKCVELSEFHGVANIYNHIYHSEREVLDLFAEFINNVDDTPKTIIIDEISDLMYEDEFKVVKFIEYCKMHSRLNIIFASQNTDDSLFTPKILKFTDHIFCFDTVLYGDKKYLLGEDFDMQLGQGEFIFYNKHDGTKTKHSIDEIEV